MKQHVALAILHPPGYPLIKPAGVEQQGGGAQGHCDIGERVVSKVVTIRA